MMQLGLIDGKKIVEGSVVLIVALAWIDVSRKFMEYVVPGPRREFYVSLLHALLITFVLIIVIVGCNSISSVMNRSNKQRGIMSRAVGETTNNTLDELPTI